MFSKIIAWIKEVIKKMFNRDDAKKFLGADIAVSPEMSAALTLWSDMYANKAPWINADTKSLNLPAAIAGEIAQSVTIELTISITGSERAKYIQDTVNLRLLPKLREQIEKGAAKGGLMMKPYVSKNKVVIDFIQADMFFPVKFDADGDITDCVFVDQRVIGDKYYTRLEYHSMTDSGCSIRNLAFRSSTPDNLGSPVPLAEVDDWASLLPEATITNITRPLFAYFRYPLANNIDPTSPLGVSCYSRAVDLIKDADKLWSDLLWEFESGQRALYADVIAFQRKDDGTPILPLKRLYRALNGSGNIDDNPEGLFHDWSPSLREQNYLNGLDAILKRIEYTCGLAYGTLSDPQSIDKTATEIKTSKQRTYATITSVQKALQNAIEQLLYAMDVWATLYNLAPKGAYSTAFDFDDSVIVDKDMQFQQDLRVVSQGIMSKVEFRMRNFGEDEKTARKMLDFVQEQQAQTDLFNAPAE